LLAFISEPMECSEKVLPSPHILPAFSSSSVRLHTEVFVRVELLCRVKDRGLVSFSKCGCPIFPALFVLVCFLLLHWPIIPILRRQRQVNLYDFRASLVYMVSSRLAKKPCLKTTKTKANTPPPNLQPQNTNQKKLQEERACFTLQCTIHCEKRSWQELKVETEAGSLESAQRTFLLHPGLTWHCPQLAGGLQENVPSAYLQAVWWMHFCQLRVLSLDNSRLY
jgi:hypothetical protein